MPKYRVQYSFDGRGIIDIEADNPEEAEKKFNDGDWPKDLEIEEMDNYEVHDVRKL